MGFKSIEDVPRRAADIAGVGWQRVSIRLVYLHDGDGLRTANISHTATGFIVAIRRQQGWGWDRQPKVYENLDEAMLVAEALCALNQ